jgi:hypothetical protein
MRPPCSPTKVNGHSIGAESLNPDLPNFQCSNSPPWEIARASWGALTVEICRRKGMGAVNGHGLRNDSNHARHRRCRIFGTGRRRLASSSHCKGSRAQRTRQAGGISAFARLRWFVSAHRQRRRCCTDAGATIEMEYRGRGFCLRGGHLSSFAGIAPATWSSTAQGKAKGRLCHSSQRPRLRLLRFTNGSGDGWC